MTLSEFENNSIYEKLNLLTDRLSEEETKSKIPIDKLNFYDTACQFINDRLKLTVPILIPLAELNNVTTELQNALGQINNFLGNSNIGHLNNADNHINAALNRIKTFPLLFSKNDFNFTKSVISFEKTVKAKLENVEKENNDLKSQLKSIQSDLIAKQNEIKKISDLLAAKTTEVTNLTSTFQTDFTNIKNTATQNYESDRKNFRAEINTDRETFRKEINQDKEKFSKEVEAKINKISTDTSVIVQELNTKLNEAKRLVNVIGNVGVTGNYQKIANEHKKVANFWRYTAIGFMSVLSGLLIYAIWDVSSANYDWVKSVIRVFAAAALSYPATYAARESSKHRKLETLNRKLELELASLTPFIELHSEDQKRDIKTKLVEKYFGNHIELTEDKIDSKEDLSIGGFEKILKAILPFMNK